jgi:hypothetical protein
VQYQAQLAVNNRGVVGVTWFDTRAAADVKHYDEYFTASTDGGATFLKPARITTETSQMFGTGNLQPMPLAARSGNVVRVSFFSGANRWRAAGDYMGLAADTNGVFHPMWSDARSGTSQIWTASVEVAKLAGTAGVKPSDLQSADVTKSIELVTDPIHYDPASHEFVMPLRLKNVSAQPIYGPIVASVVKFGSGAGEQLREFAPEILNATNQKKGDGASFDYSGALGDLPMLAPGATTGEMVWKLRIGDPEKIPDMHVSVAGMTTAKAK